MKSFLDMGKIVDMYVARLFLVICPGFGGKKSPNGLVLIK